MPKINKETLTVTKQDINSAMTNLFGLLQGYLDGENLMKSGSSQLKYPAENISDYPSSIKPIVADKYIAAKDMTTLETVDGLYDDLEANRDYTVLGGSITLSWIGGVEKATNSSWGFYSPRFNPKKEQRDASLATKAPSTRTIVIPKSTSVIPIRDGAEKLVYTPYIRVKHNLEDKDETHPATVTVLVNEPVDHPEFIEVHVDTFLRLKDDPWTEGRYLNIFIDVEVLCEVLP